MDDEYQSLRPTLMKCQPMISNKTPNLNMLQVTLGKMTHGAMNKFSVELNVLIHNYMPRQMTRWKSQIHIINITVQYNNSVTVLVQLKGHSSSIFIFMYSKLRIKTC